MKRYPIRSLIIDKFNPLEKTNLELSGGSRPRLVLQYKRTKKRVLIKSYRHNPHEIYSEYLASRLAEVCNIPAQSAVFKVIPPHVIEWLKDINLQQERYFTPLFDHGSSLMFELPESKLKQMLKDTDQIASYTNRKYGFILTPEGKKGNVFDILVGYSKISDTWKRRVKSAVSLVADHDFIDFQNSIERMPVNDSYGWTENRKNVIVKCLEMRYNYIQQLS